CCTLGGVTKRKRDVLLGRTATSRIRDIEGETYYSAYFVLSFMGPTISCTCGCLWHGHWHGVGSSWR
ncbi:hypothetical protein KI387_033765, partial [Taxus chinensis]